MKLIKDKRKVSKDIKLTNLDKVKYFEGSWEACKEKVLEILKNPSNRFPISETIG